MTFEQLRLHNFSKKGSPIDDIMSLCAQELISLQAQLEKVDAFTWLQSRHSRGLVDAGGMLLSLVFSLATEGQVAEITRQVNLVTRTLHNSNVAIVDMQHDQKSLMNDMWDIQKQVNQLNQYAKQNSQVTSVIHKLILLKMQMDKIYTFLNFATQLDKELFKLLAATKHSDNTPLP